MSGATLAPTMEPPSGKKRRTRGGYVCSWIERYCVHTTGEWIGEPFCLLPWQKAFIRELFEVEENDQRRYRWALLGVPKKNGKSELAAALALYFLIGDGEPSPLVVCAAASEEQADLVFGAAKKMCEMSPMLRQITECFDKEITVPSIPGARLQRVAAIAGTNDGKNISAAILDELHEWTGTKGENVWNVLTNGTGARRQPMVLQITTAGFDVEGTICGRQYEYGCQVRDGAIEDRRYYFHWVQAPDGADHRDPAVWEAANPSYGVLVHPEFFQDQLTKKTESVFRRYFLNQWVASEEIWIPYGVWDEGVSDLELDPTLPLYVGIDIAKTIDSSALVRCQRQAERFVLRATIWTNPYPEGNPLRERWRMNNHLVMDLCRELFQQFPKAACQIDDETRPGPCFAFDPWRFRDEADTLTGEGLAMVEFPQTDGNMVPASQAFYEAIMTRRVAHDGDPVFKAHVQNVTADQRARGWRMSKPTGSRRKIDAAVAGGISVWCAMTQQAGPARRSAYEEHEVMAV